MNKRAARKLIETETLTFGALKAAVETIRESSGQSSVNTQFTKKQIAGIYADGIADRANDEVIKAWRYDVFKDRYRHSKDSMIAVNIVRDCM